MIKVKWILFLGIEDNMAKSRAWHGFHVDAEVSWMAV